jgi:hypothetical protein
MNSSDNTQDLDALHAPYPDIVPAARPLSLIRCGEHLNTTSPHYVFHLIVTPDGREQDAEEVVDALSRKHGLRVDGEPPRYRIELDAKTCRALESGSLEDPLQTLLVDLAYDGAVKNLTIGWHTVDAQPPGTTSTRLEIGDFIASSRDRGLEEGIWYRLHAPAGYRCRPRSFS